MFIATLYVRTYYVSIDNGGPSKRRRLNAGRYQRSPLPRRQKVLQFLHPVHDHVRLEFPGIEYALGIALHPDGTQAAGLGADYVERVARNDPKPLAGSLHFRQEIFVYGRIRLKATDGV